MTQFRFLLEPAAHHVAKLKNVLVSQCVVHEKTVLSPGLLHRGTVLESPMDNLLTSSYLASTGAEIALSHGWRYGTPIPAGPITAGDLWQMIPTNPEVFTVNELRHMLEQSIERTFSGDLLSQQGGYIMRFAGMRVVARLNNAPGTRVQQLEIAGRPALPSREYTVAVAGEQTISPDHDRTMTGLARLTASALISTNTVLPTRLPLTRI